MSLFFTICSHNLQNPSRTRLQTHIAKLYAASDSSLVSLMLIFVASQVGIGSCKMHPHPPSASASPSLERGTSSSWSIAYRRLPRFLLTFAECTISLTVCASKGVRSWFWSCSWSPGDRASGCRQGVNVVTTMPTAVRRELSPEDLRMVHFPD